MRAWQYKVTKIRVALTRELAALTRDIASRTHRRATGGAMRWSAESAGLAGAINGFQYPRPSSQAPRIHFWLTTLVLLKLLLFLVYQGYALNIYP